LFVVGGQLTGNGSVIAWMNTASANPMPLTVQLMLLSDVITPAYFPDIPSSQLAVVQNNTLTALYGYCELLKTQSLVTQCTAPNPDPPLPQPSVFGGMYQADDCGVENVANVFTGQMSCPSGYHYYRVGRILTPQSKCGAYQFVCLHDNMTADPQTAYGGAYQVTNTSLCKNPQSDIMYNPLTNGLSCPLGYTAVASARIYAPDANCPGTQYSCIRTNSTPIYETTAGFYQRPDSGSVDVVTNIFTGATSCPSGYCPAQRGRVLTPDSKVGSNLYACIACNLINITYSASWLH